LLEAEFFVDFVVSSGRDDGGRPSG